MQRSNRFRLLVAMLVALILMSSAGAYITHLRSSCGMQAVEESSVILIRQRNRYDHSYQFAVTASRDAIVRPVVDLQQIVMDTQEISVPDCMQTSKAELIAYMETVILAFQAYGTGESNAAVRDLVNESQTHYDRFTSELKMVRECAPFCMPWK